MRPLRRDEKQWLFPASTLQQTPSREHGITYEQELQKRARTIDYIRSLAARCGLTAEEDKQNRHGGRARGVAMTASTLVHRFYMRRALRDFPPELMAPTILFIASKIEEEPIKLRHVVNCCLEKFEGATKDKLWMPVTEHPPQPSHEYRRWEHEILSAEEVTHETLCFDMTVIEPWGILRRALSGLEEIWVASGGRPYIQTVNDGDELLVEQQSQDRNGEGSIPGASKRTRRVTEVSVVTASWTLLSELYLYPISVVYHPYIIAFAAATIILQLFNPLGTSPPPALLRLARRFHLEDMVDPNGDIQVGSTDMAAVSDCIRQIHEFAAVDLRIQDKPILKEMWRWIPPLEPISMAPGGSVDAGSKQTGADIPAEPGITSAVMTSAKTVEAR